MLEKYHRQITNQALQDFFSKRALQVILAANLRQDSLRNQIWHPEYHFDDNSFSAGYAYISEQIQTLLDSLTHNSPLSAWQAFGRLTHTVQDLYAHSNYVELWIAQHPDATPDQITSLEEAILKSPNLITGRIYYPLEVLAFVPGLTVLIKHFLPRDSHTWMNLDSPHQGPLFEYAFNAAVLRTRTEFHSIQQQIKNRLGPTILSTFTGVIPAINSSHA